MNKKKKAAIMGVLYYLRKTRKVEYKKKNHWGKLGRKIIMRNRQYVQARTLR